MVEFPRFRRRNKMSGHSKWKTIQRRKTAQDAKRGKVFTRHVKEITVAARTGGGVPENNPRLRTAIAAAKAENVPAENIKRAIQRGTGELPGVNYEEVTYEGYAPGGVAVLVEALTDNKNRTLPEIRHIFEKAGGNLGQDGCVSWMFQKKGLILIDSSASTEERLMEIALDAGAEDLKAEKDYFEIHTLPENFEQVKAKIEEAKIPMLSAEIEMVPQQTIRVEGKVAQQVLRFMDTIEDHDDVQNFYSNFEMDDAELAGS